MITAVSHRRLLAWSLAFMAAAAADPARGESPWRGIKSPHFAVLAMTEEFTAGRITEAQLRQTADRFERLYSLFVDEWKLLPPAGPPPKIGQAVDPRVVIFVYDWTKAGPYKDSAEERNEAEAFHTFGKIHLKIDHLLSDSTQPGFVSPSRQVEIATHELFHAVQRAYDGRRRFGWMREATAQWAVWLSTMTDVTHDVRRREQRFLSWCNLPIGYFETLATNPKPGVSVGHPYGTSVLFRFLGDHHGGAELLKKFLEAWQANREFDGPPTGPTDGYYPLALIAQALGTTGPDDPDFRIIYDRFTAACALGPDAPTYPLADAATFKYGADRANSGWDVHYLDAARSPDDVLYQVPSADELKILTAGTSAFDLRQKHAMLVRKTEIGTGGFCSLSIPRPHGLAPNSLLSVEVPAAQGEISLQGLIRRRLDQPVEILAGSYDAGRQAYVLRIPKFETAADLDVKADTSEEEAAGIAHAYDEGLDEVLVVVTRYGLGPPTDAQPQTLVQMLLGDSPDRPNPPREDAKHFPVYIAIAAPPTVTRLKLSQQNKTIYDAKWVETVDESGVLEARIREIAAGDAPPIPPSGFISASDGAARARSETKLEAGLGDAAVEVWFSSPITEATPPELLINGQTIRLAPFADEDRWHGVIPTSSFGTGTQKFHIRAVSTPRGTKLQLPLDEDPLTVAALGTKIDPLDETVPRAANWTGYEHTGAGMLVLLNTEAVGFKIEDAAQVDPRFVNPTDPKSVPSFGVTFDRTGGASIGGRWGTGAKPPGTKLSDTGYWSVRKVTPDLAKRLMESHFNSCRQKEREKKTVIDRGGLPPVLASLAGIDAKFDPGDLRVAWRIVESASPAGGGKFNAVIRSGLESYTLYRNEFVISITCEEVGPEGDDFAAERTRLIEQTKQIIDKRFPK